MKESLKKAPLKPRIDGNKLQMGSIADYLANGLKKLRKFLNSGYVLTISARDIDETAFNRVKTIIKESGFIFVNDNIHRDAIVSQYTRKRNYLISLTLIHTNMKYPARRLDLRINILNEYKGGKSEITADIDSLGARLYEELSQSVGESKLTRNTYRTIPDV